MGVGSRQFDGGEHARELRAYLEDVCEALPRARRVRSWTEWRRAVLGLSLPLLLVQCHEEVEPSEVWGGESGVLPDPSVVIETDGGPVVVDVPPECPGTDCTSVCTGGGDADDDGRVDAISAACVYYCEQPADTEEGSCFDGLDDDGDCRVDCADSDCLEVCTPPTETDCFDTDDEDLDELIDCADPDCAERCQHDELELNCVNGVDDDGDGTLDEADIDCQLLACFVHGCCYAAGGMVACEHCSNEGDDDFDGLVDCDDPNCFDSPFCKGEENCYSGRDEDGDGLAGCADPDCLLFPPCE